MKKLPLYLMLVLVVAAIVVVLRTRNQPAPAAISPPVETLPIAPDLDSIPPDSAYFGGIQEHRAEMNLFLRGEESPLEEDVRSRFTGLDYFPIDPKYRFVLPLEVATRRDTVTIMDTKGAERKFEVAGTLHLTVDGVDTELTLFREPYHNYFFLPFRDATAGIDTYEVGRYVEPRPADSGRFLVDFNLAYNPYCAYSHRWACPIPPEENVLNVAIPAGEKKFQVQG